MSNPEQPRISVLRGDKVVPLIPSAHLHTAPQPWRGILLERHHVSPLEIPEHQHRDLCLHLQISGDSDFDWWSEGRHRVERTAPGSMILLSPGTSDRLLWRGPSERLVLSVTPAALQQAASELEAAHLIELRDSWNLNDPALRRILAEMGEQSADDWPLGTLYADVLGRNLLLTLLRNHAAFPVHVPEVKGGLPMPRLRHALDYITANLHRDLRLDDIARELSLSPFHFARQFRNSTGQTPYQFLLDQRIARAKQLLRRPGLSIQAIGFETGFRSPVQFIRSFRQRVGLTPGDWRRQL